MEPVSKIDVLSIFETSSLFNFTCAIHGLMLFYQEDIVPNSYFIGENNVTTNTTQCNLQGPIVQGNLRQGGTQGLVIVSLQCAQRL